MFCGPNIFAIFHLRFARYFHVWPLSDEQTNNENEYESMRLLLLFVLLLLLQILVLLLWGREMSGERPICREPKVV